MILFPAVDIKNGECVRLAQGKEDQVTVFGTDPVVLSLEREDVSGTVGVGWDTICP